MGHIESIKKMLIDDGLSEEQFEQVKKILFEYYKKYVRSIEDKIGLFLCNKIDFIILLKIALSNENTDYVLSELKYDIYSRYFHSDDQQEKIKNFDLYDHWQSLVYGKRQSPDEELFEKILQLF